VGFWVDVLFADLVWADTWAGKKKGARMSDMHRQKRNVGVQFIAPSADLARPWGMVLIDLKQDFTDGRLIQDILKLVRLWTE
jgi:hypothetical protein